MEDEAEEEYEVVDHYEAAQQAIVAALLRDRLHRTGKILPPHAGPCHHSDRLSNGGGVVLANLERNKCCHRHCADDQCMLSCQGGCYPDICGTHNSIGSLGCWHEEHPVAAGGK